jgi:hypothetical protein
MSPIRRALKKAQLVRGIEVRNIRSRDHNPFRVRPGVSGFPRYPLLSRKHTCLFDAINLDSMSRKVVAAPRSETQKHRPNVSIV